MLINTNNQLLQIVLINLSFKDYRVNDKLDWILNRQVDNFISPEILDGVAPSIKSDLYSVGAVLYFLSFYDPTLYKTNKTDGDFYEIMEEFEIS